MYERIIKNLTEGSNDLPSILQLTNENGYTHNKLDNYYDNKNIPFSVEFGSGVPTNELSQNIKNIYNDIQNKKDISLKRLTLENGFTIFKIDDYSYQEMTMNNYDYFVKLFVEFNGEKYKISSKTYFIIKSYLHKKAWIFLDKVVSKNIEKSATYSCIIDFTYRFFKDETTKNIKFPALNNYSNIQNLFNNPQLASPYYDKFYIDDDSGLYSVLNLQNKYFLYSLNDNLNNSFKSENKINKINKLSLTDNNSIVTDEEEISTLANLDRFKIKYLTSLSNTTYLNSAAYEIYGYSSSYLGKRILGADSDFSEYEIYPTLADFIHYIFKVKTTPNSESGYTIDKIRKVMYDNKIYLYNCPFSNFNVFTEGESTYIEVYIQLPNGDNILSDDDIKKLDSDELEIEKVTLTSDTRSELDPSFYNQVSSDTDEDKFVPYFGNDKFVSPILPEDTVRVYANSDIELNDFSKGKDYSTYFDILSKNTDTSEANKLTDEYAMELINNFKSYGFRNSEISTYSDFVSKLNNYEKQKLVLCKNLSLLKDGCNCETCNSTTITVTDKFFIYFKNVKPCVDATITYNDHIDIRKWFSYQQIQNSGYVMYLFIIPIEDDMNTIQIPDNSTGMTVYW